MARNATGHMRQPALHYSLCPIKDRRQGAFFKHPNISTAVLRFFLDIPQVYPSSNTSHSYFTNFIQPMATYREILNNIVTWNRLQVSYSEDQEGPGHDARWVSVYTLYSVGAIGRAWATTKLEAKELAAKQAIAWLDSRGYKAKARA